MELFAEIFEGLESLTIFSKSFILDHPFITPPNLRAYALPEPTKMIQGAKAVRYFLFFCITFFSDDFKGMCIILEVKFGHDQKQPPEVFCKKVVLKNYTKFTKKHLCQSLFFNKVAGLTLWHRCFSVNFAKFLRTPYLQNTSGRLLLDDP